MGESDTLRYDPFTFRKHFKNIGRAYREQATTLIEMCRLYADAAPKTYTEDDRLQSIFRLADAALSAAGRANKGTTSEAAEAFLHVQKVIKRFGSPPPNDAPAPHRKILHNLGTAMEAASKKDETSTGFVAKVKSKFSTPDPKGPIKKVKFVILKSPHEPRTDQSIVHQEIDESTTTSEIIWRFSRYPENSPWRIAFKQNPHFYVGLSDDAASYGSKFHQDPLKDFAYRQTQGQTDTIYVLSDKSCRLFLDGAEPHIPRIFSNLWKPHRTVILKDVVGNLDSEDLVPFEIGDSQDYWYRPSIVVDQSQHPVGSGYSHVDSTIVQKPVRNWRAVIDSALKSQKVDLMIRDRTMPEPTSEWTRLPSDSYPQPEPPNFSTSSLSSNTLSATSTAVNPSYTSLLMPEAPRIKRTQPDGSSKDLRLKVPDIPPKPPPTAPAGYSMTIPSPIPEQEPKSANPFRRKGRRKMFEAYAIEDP